MYKKYKHTKARELIIEYKDYNEFIFKKCNFPKPDKSWITTNWKSWKQIEEWTKLNGWKEVKEPITEVDYLNAFQDNFKDGG